MNIEIKVTSAELTSLTNRASPTHVSCIVTQFACVRALEFAAFAPGSCVREYELI